MKLLAASSDHVDKSYFTYPIELQHAEIGCSSHCRFGGKMRDSKLNPDNTLPYFTLRLFTATFNVLESVNIYLFFLALRAIIFVFSTAR
jgi:hypothetical protein